MKQLTLAQIESTFGDLAFSEGEAGRVVIHADWAVHSLAHLTPPFALYTASGARVREIVCHHLIVDRLEAVLNDLLRDDLTPLVNTFDGCFVPRHMGWDPARPLSRHSWGIAVDLNARTCPLGSSRRQDQRLVAAFARHGFLWGGDWDTPDPMHFEISDAILTGSAGVSPASPAPPPDSLPLTLDGAPLLFPARIINGAAYVPLRALADALGLHLDYDATLPIAHLRRH